MGGVLVRPIILTVCIYVFLKFIVPNLPHSAPLPSSLIFLYLMLTTAGIVIFATLSGALKDAFFGPMDESLVQIEQEFPERFLRVHRSCLVARGAVAGVERDNEEDGEGHWVILVRGTDARLPVSRRQWPVLKQALGL